MTPGESAGRLLLHAVFERRRHVVDFGDRQVAVHRAMAGDQNLVLHAAHVHVVAIDQLADIPPASEFRNSCTASRKLLHFLARRQCALPAARCECSRAFRRTVSASDFFFQSRGPAVRFAQARVFVHFQMQLDEQAARRS